MHGIVSESRDTGDIQSEDVKVSIVMVLIRLQKKKSDIDVVLDAIEQEAEMTPEEEGNDEDEDYELLFGKKRPSEDVTEKKPKVNKIVYFWSCIKHRILLRRKRQIVKPSLMKLRKRFPM